MAVFSSKRYTPSARGGSNGNASLNKIIRRNPILFGGPFLFLIVGGSFALQSFTQTRYDLYNSKTNQMSAEEEDQIKHLRRKVDKREEYFRLSAETTSPVLDDWEPKRIARPTGLPEWGVAPSRP